ncbi:MAG: phenylalanine--tRNA ligase subunit beta [Pyrinomonadaceae bacterium]
MNISYNWLKDLIDIDLSADELGKKLTSVGLAVEGIHPHGDDLVLDIDLTSNRPDCLSHLGVARELGAIENVSMKHAASDLEAGSSSGDFVTIDCPELCHRFTARIIKNVKIGPSPKWLVDRLEAIGERSINNVADITNYVMHELGQPMHSFDLDKLSGGRIIVRKAKADESITTLDEVERKLDTSMVVVCDAEKPAAIGGVMGGLDSSITDTTVNVLLEVAYFDRKSVRTTSRRLNLATEASYRFERGVDIEKLTDASNRATALICELAGGEAGEFIDVYPTKRTPHSVSSPDISAAVKRLTGLDVNTEGSVRILNSLGITAEAAATYSAPSWRHDIHIEEDLVEEVARHAGYHNIGTELPPAFGAGEYQPTESREKRLRQALIDTGFDEALSYSFIDTKHDGVFEVIPGVLDDSIEEPYVTLQDSVIEGAVRMRPSSLSGLLDAVRLNLNHQRRDIKLFEVGKVFAAMAGEDGLPNEQKSFALVVTGGEVNQDRVLVSRPVDFYDAKGAVESALEAAGVSGVSFSAADVKHLRPGQSASIALGEMTIGYLGRLNDVISAGYKFKQPVYVAELNLSTALSRETDQITYKPLAKFPGVVRDVSFVVDRKMQFEAIRSAIISQGNDLCRSVSFVDVYEGKGLGDGERSITIRLEYRSDDRTLIEDEVEASHQNILAKLESDLGIKPRF